MSSTTSKSFANLAAGTQVSQDYYELAVSTIMKIRSGIHYVMIQDLTGLGLILLN